MVSPAVAGAARPRIVYLYLAIVVGSWAGNWPIMKLALADAPGPVFVLLRLVGTLALMGPVLTARCARRWCPIAASGSANSSSANCRSPAS